MVSDRLFVNSLRMKCENKMAELLNSDKCPRNALKLFSFSLQTTAQFLALKCARIISRDITVLLETGGLNNIHSEDLEVLRRGLKNPESSSIRFAKFLTR